MVVSDESSCPSGVQADQAGLVAEQAIGLEAPHGVLAKYVAHAAPQVAHTAHGAWLRCGR